MWIANDWKEYEVIDTSCGEKLERWGKYTLVRPDPQVIWDTPKISRGWKNMNAHYHRSKKGGGEWEFFDLPQQWDLHYKDLTFHLKPFSFKHTGLFPEQATNWDWFGDKIRNAGLTVACTDDGVPAPAEARLILQCRKLYVGKIRPEEFVDRRCDTKWYPQHDYHEVYIAEIERAYVRK